LKRLAALLTLSLAACASGQGGGPSDGPRLRPAANPSAVIAAEIGFSRLAQEKGQWTAFRETAAKGAEMFVPDRVLAQDWLKGRADPPVPVRWQPSEVWSSCDGSYAVTRGAWQRPGSLGSFVTVWQRQKNGGYKWLLDMSLADEAAPASADTVNATVADCPRDKREGSLASPVPSTPQSRSGQSDDGTLDWTAHSGEGARNFTLRMIKGGSMREVLTARLPGAAAR
jgi:hypothetical protein